MIPPEKIITVVGARIHFLPVKTRVPLKFGSEKLTEVTCLRVEVEVCNGNGQRGTGWGETPLSVQWVWPGSLPYDGRLRRMQEFCGMLGGAFSRFEGSGHPLEISSDFQEGEMRGLLAKANEAYPAGEGMPLLAALVCFSAFDIAVHDAFGKLLGVPSFQTFSSEFMSRDLCGLLDGESGFEGKYPSDFLRPKPLEKMRAWHLVGGLDPLEDGDPVEVHPQDAHPVYLRDWIRRDGLECLKIKLRGNDAEWDFERLVKIGRLAVEEGVLWLTADFNCTVNDPGYVTAILDQLRDEEPVMYGMLLYVEQPFPYELEEHPINVFSVSARKPLFLDESAHDWKHVRLGKELGWNGVALKTCKTLSGAIFSACWALKQGMTLMVQDLTNPMLAQIPHVSLAANVPTIMGVETNGMQYYPEASAPEAVVHPGIYQRRNGCVDLSTIRGPGLGYRLEEIRRELPPVFGAYGSLA